MIRRTNHKPGDAIISNGKSYFIAKDGSYVPYVRARHGMRADKREQVL